MTSINVGLKIIRIILVRNNDPPDCGDRIEESILSYLRPHVLDVISSKNRVSKNLGPKKGSRFF